ncbi:MAG: hypothetical protein LIO93_00115, partial [Bacteroidales bacterium]|nr:hypothetical protein [Bacteroidales bacterium]
IKNQSKKYLSLLKAKVKNKIRKIRKLYYSINIEKEKQRLRLLGIREENVYLFLRGHNIYSLCVSLGRDVCEWILDEEKKKLNGNTTKIIELYNDRKTFKEKLKNNIHFEQYPAISKIGKDVEYYKILISS